MSSLPAGTPVVNLFADEWDPQTVGQFALYATRQPGSIAHLAADLRVQARKPIVNGECAVNTRHWIVTDSDGEILAQAPSLFQAIHSLAH